MSTISEIDPIAESPKGEVNFDLKTPALIRKDSETEKGGEEGNSMLGVVMALGVAALAVGAFLIFRKR